jgi:DNA-3-methyladenine glycosylase I
MKEIIRCFGTGNKVYEQYHDTEWGRPIHGENELFEYLTLEGAHAGLSWLTILNKRENYRKLYYNFDPEIVAKYDENKILGLLENTGIVRHKLKVRASVKNANVFLAIQKEFGSFDTYIWNFVNNKTIKNNFQTRQQIPGSTKISDKISKDLKKRGMSFVGSTIMYAFMQAVGMVDDHFIGCCKYEK